MKRRLVILGLVGFLGIGLVGAQYVVPTRQPSVPLHVQYTITATATALSDSDILNSTQAPKKLTIKNASGAANNCFLGSEVVANTPANAGVELAAGQAYTYSYQAPNEIYLVGTANAANIAFIVAEY